ncbi:MAG: hypothetical protein ABR502_03180 [Chitinophagaceae bacterium]
MNISSEADKKNLLFSQKSSRKFTGNNAGMNKPLVVFIITCLLSVLQLNAQLSTTVSNPQAKIFPEMFSLSFPRVHLSNTVRTLKDQAFYKLASNYYTHHSGVFCRKELQLQKSTNINLFVRLGSKEYVDYLEKKPNAAIR